MSNQIIPIYIPTFIGDQNYAPNRVLPHVYFYNGQLECQPFFVADQYDSNRQVNAFPYFDNYSVVTGSFPTPGSKSLLFNNENAPYGSVPTSSLYTEYWETYISLLYNPKTRLVNCSAIIPLADYVKMELNDVVNFRGNYYYLRAINDYSVKTGQCKLQLLGPIIQDTLSDLQPTPEPPTPPITGSASSSVSWSYTESAQNGTFTIYDNATTLATLTANGTGNAWVSQSHYVTASLVPVGYPSSGSVTMSLFVNGGTTISTTAYTNTTITASFLVGSGSSYGITGSIQWNDTPIPPTSGSASLDWSYTITNANGTMDIYVNGINVESRNATSNGTYTVYEGDEIYVDIYTDGCINAPNTTANAYVTGDIVGSTCGSGMTGMSTDSNPYIVSSGDVGTTLIMDCFSSCDTACV